MQLERTLQPGQIWQHYKGNDYKILLVTGGFVPIDDWDKLPKITGIKHSETQESLELVRTRMFQIVLALSRCKQMKCNDLYRPHVIYQRVDPEFPQVWARPLDVFLDILSTPYIKGFATSNYSRFTRIS